MTAWAMVSTSARVRYLARRWASLWGNWSTDRDRHCIISSGGKDSLLSYALLKEAGKEVMEGRWRRALRSVHLLGLLGDGENGEVKRLAGEESARLALYIRAHWLRMPPGQLLTHLSKKAIRRWQGDDEECQNGKLDGSFHGAGDLRGEERVGLGGWLNRVRRGDDGVIGVVKSTGAPGEVARARPPANRDDRGMVSMDIDGTERA